MKKKIIITAILTVLAVAAVFYFIIRANYANDNAAGKIKASDKTVYINDKVIPAYDFNNNIYIIAENLKLFGIDINYSKKENALKIMPKKKYFIIYNDFENSLVKLKNGTKIKYTNTKTYVDKHEIQGYKVKKYTLIPLSSLKAFGALNYNNENKYYCTLGDFTELEFETASSPSSTFDPAVIAGNIKDALAKKKIIVLDAGHGKSSSAMTADEKSAEGWVYNQNTGGWGEWRHFKYGEKTGDCNGSGCSKRITPNGDCWYAIGSGDRSLEPEINLNNCLAAKKYLEDMGYTVRMARSSNSENPSITKRLSYCYPNNDTSKSPDALAYICIHSNAGGGSGTSYIALSGEYDQPEIPDNYVEAGNTLGKYINDKVSAASGLSNNSPITFEPELIAFCKAPVICAYLEIGFFDNSSDLSILNNSSDAIGKAIAEGIDSYIKDTK